MGLPGGIQRSLSSGGVMMRRSTASGLGITENARRAGRIVVLRTSAVYGSLGMRAAPTLRHRHRSCTAKGQWIRHVRSKLHNWRRPQVSGVREGVTACPRGDTFKRISVPSSERLTESQRLASFTRIWRKTTRLWQVPPGMANICQILAKFHQV